MTEGSYPMPHAEIVYPCLGLLLSLLGWPLAARRIAPNRWYGLRVPATFADTRVWYDANALAGRDMVILGAVVFVAAIALPRMMHVNETAYTVVCAGILGIGSLLLAVRGWRTANRLLRERRKTEPSGR
jgi:uncharacterized membrane protein